MAATHSEEFKRHAVRIALTSGLARRQVASDLGVRLWTLGKWIRAISDETKVPDRDADLLRENERLRHTARVRIILDFKGAALATDTDLLEGHCSCKTKPAEA